MALVVNQQPQKYTPAFSPQLFQATSTNVAQPNHSYTIKWYDMISGVGGTQQIYKDPIYNSMVWDASDKSQTFMQYFKPAQVGGFQKATGSIRQFRVNIGETYGATPTYYAGTDYDYFIWTGQIDFLEASGYGFGANKYIYNQGVNNVYMAGILNDVTFANKSNFIYVLSNHLTGTRIAEIKIKCYGTGVTTSIIANPHATGANTYDKNFVLMDVGTRGLNALTALEVAGTYPVLNSTVYKYEVIDYSDPMNEVIIKTINIGCENIYNPMLVHYLAKNGALQTANFSLMQTKTITKEFQRYGKQPFVNSGTAYAYDISSRPNRQYGITTQDTLKLRTDWLSDDQITKYKELWSSPLTLLEGDANYPDSLIAVEPITNIYIDIPKRKSKLYAWENDFIYSHLNYRQHV